MHYTTKTYLNLNNNLLVCIWQTIKQAYALSLHGCMLIIPTEPKHATNLAPVTIWENKQYVL